MTTLPRTFALDTDRDTFDLGRNTNVVLWTAQVTLAWYFAFEGMGKVAGLSPDIAAAFNVAATGDTGRALVGALQIVGAIALLVPRLAGVGALWLAGLLLVTFAAKVPVLPPSFAAVTPVLVIVLAVIAWMRRSGRRVAESA